MIPSIILKMIAAQCFGFFALEILKLFFFYMSFQNAPRRICNAKNRLKPFSNLRAEGKTWKDIDLVFEEKED